MWTHFEVELDYLVRRATYPGWEIAPRRIANYELVFLLKGRGSAVMENRRYDLGPRELLCIRPGLLHSLAAPQEPCMEFYGVHFTLPEGVARLPLPELSRIDNPTQLEGLFRTLLEVHRKKDYLYRWRQNLLLQEILCLLFTRLHQENMPVEQARIKKVLDEIHEDPARPFTLEGLTELAGVKKTLFLRSFRNVTGTTPMRYILSLRLEYARELLLETQLPVARIGEMCGFMDPFYFSRRFKEIFGEPPQRYRASRL